MTKAEAKHECKRCSAVKLQSQFYKATTIYKGKKHTYYSWCKKCHDEYHKKWRAKNEGKWSECHKRWVKDNREWYLEIKRKSQKKYCSKNPQKMKARAIAFKYRDELIKESCECCSGFDNLHMHHPDYLKPLEVMTLCRPCHDKEHYRKTN